MDHMAMDHYYTDDWGGGAWGKLVLRSLCLLMFYVGERTRVSRRSRVAVAIMHLHINILS